MIKICPKCKGLAHYNSYFKAYICLSPECTWMEEVRINMIKRLDRLFEKYCLEVCPRRCECDPRHKGKIAVCHWCHIDGFLGYVEKRLDDADIEVRDVEQTDT